MLPFIHEWLRGCPPFVAMTQGHRPAGERKRQNPTASGVAENQDQGWAAPTRMERGDSGHWRNPWLTGQVLGHPEGVDPKREEKRENLTRRARSPARRQTKL